MVNDFNIILNECFRICEGKFSKAVTVTIKKVWKRWNRCLQNDKKQRTSEDNTGQQDYKDKKVEEQALQKSK